ncbi:aldose epimerase family protein [Lutibacter flavus]|uniref:Aldose 1-epimerase n=1 Tax=Lutibacter flavus TaxID=691689 RepID=A0A238YGX7_9FLAO|nr:aldose epimerase family protein [Lutibacter flavus]SNR70212.1 aldose 1-epimerase [Lutibacter flavus]
MNVLKRSLAVLSLISFAYISVQCKENKKDKSNEMVSEIKNPITIAKEAYGVTSDSINVESYTLKNEKGMEVTIITYGGIITTLKVPNKDNKIEDVVLGYNSIEEYQKSTPYFGALIGRYGNRIAKGKFSLDGIEYTLAANDGSNHLHGGVKGFDKVVWTAEVLEDTGSLKLSYLSKDMEEGYPGNLETVVIYKLTNDNELEVSYEATTDKKTIVNLTQHSYFNLSGDFSKPILDHEITINADKFVPVDAILIPTGELKDVANTPFDFRVAKSVGQDIEVENEQLKRGLGYDHCWVLNNQNEGIRLTSSAYHKESGRLLEVFSDEPGIQLYTGNFLDGTLPNKQGGTYGHRTGFCLETQHYPDSPNQKDFPSVVLNPGEKYKTTTSFKFSVK